MTFEDVEAMKRNYRCRFCRQILLGSGPQSLCQKCAIVAANLIQQGRVQGAEWMRKQAAAYVADLSKDYEGLKPDHDLTESVAEILVLELRAVSALLEHLKNPTEDDFIE